MDDIEAYRKRHHEAYRRRNNLAPETEDASTSTSYPGKDKFPSSQRETASANNVGSPPSVSVASRNVETNFGDQLKCGMDTSSGCVNTGLNASTSSQLPECSLNFDDVDYDEAELAMGDPMYESSLELAKRLQEELNKPSEPSRGDDENIRKPDDTYHECLLGSESVTTNIYNEDDIDLQAAIAKSLIDM